MEGTKIPEAAGEANQQGKREIRSVRRSAGAPQRMDPLRALQREEVQPPSLEELQARQDEMSPTRRPTKLYRAEREEVDAESVQVPEVPATECDEPEPEPA